VSLFRLFSMRTSKVSQWPKEVDATCVVERDDPYAIEGAANGDRVAVFPEAAAAVGVSFSAPPSNPQGMKDRAHNSAGVPRGSGKPATAKKKTVKNRK
jgi:hypothetical protein